MSQRTGRPRGANGGHTDRQKRLIITQLSATHIPAATPERILRYALLDPSIATCSAALLRIQTRSERHTTNTLLEARQQLQHGGRARTQGYICSAYPVGGSKYRRSRLTSISFTTAFTNMPSPPSTASTHRQHQPTSPLSPRNVDTRHTTMAHSARRPAMRATGSSARGPSLKLPSLPRFHPANFPSQSSSFANTPVSGVNSPQPLMSPRSQQRQYSEAQKQLYAYQRELLSNVGKVAPKQPSNKPVSPRLAPAASPGAVTPLELENEGGYLMAGGRSQGTNEQAQSEYVEKLIREEAARRGEISPKRTTTVGSY